MIAARGSKSSPATHITAAASQSCRSRRNKYLILPQRVGNLYNKVSQPINDIYIYTLCRANTCQMCINLARPVARMITFLRELGLSAMHCIGIFKFLSISCDSSESRKNLFSISICNPILQFELTRRLEL
jgi:hypothetical protein